MENAYFLDVDGTLIGLAPAPADVQVPGDLVATLQALHHRAGGALALVSGRPLAELDTLFAPLHLPAAGQHGAERRDAQGQIVRASPPGHRHLSLRRALDELARENAGVTVEDKGLTLAIHYRSAPDAGQWLKARLEALYRGLDDDWRLQPGKMVFEFRPPDADKGHAIASFLGEPPFRGRRPVFIGDDVTDEDGFREVNAHDGISIKVGAGETAARCRLPDVDAVHRWLRERLDDIPEAGTGS